MAIDYELISKVTKTIDKNIKFSTLGWTNSKIENTLSFIDHEKYIPECLLNTNIKGLFLPEKLSSLIKKQRSDITLLISEDPRYDYYILQNIISEANLNSDIFSSIISPKSNIHHRSYICENNVIIEDNVVIEPNVTILSNVVIRKNSIVRAGTVIGAEGFDHKRTSKGILSVKHDGNVIIGENVDIGANCAISKGYSYRNTIIGNHTKLDNLVHVAHCVQIGERCFLPAACMIAGSTTIGDDVWIGPNATISSQITIESGAYITLGSVVTKNVGANKKVTGNFAIDHSDFLSILKSNIKSIQR